MDEVKDEIFGTRKKWLKSLLDSENIEYIENVWVATCRGQINSNKLTRYAIFLEEESYHLNNLIHLSIPIYFVNLKEDNTIELKNLRDGRQSLIEQDIFIRGLVKKMECEFVSSSGALKSESNNFSNFFRSKMGKGFSLTDIDYVILSNNILCEEKNYIENNNILLGLGQFLSYSEVLNDIFITSKVIMLAKNEDNFYFSEIEKKTTAKWFEHKRWGKMVPFPCSLIDKESLLNKLK